MDGVPLIRFLKNPNTISILHLKSRFLKDAPERPYSGDSNFFTRSVLCFLFSVIYPERPRSVLTLALVNFSPGASFPWMVSLYKGFLKNPNTISILHFKSRFLKDAPAWGSGSVLDPSTTALGL